MSEHRVEIAAHIPPDTAEALIALGWIPPEGTVTRRAGGHTVTLVAELRALEPEASGWARYERTGRTALACTCGWIDPFTDDSDDSGQPRTVDRVRAHVADHAQQQPE